MRQGKVIVAHPGSSSSPPSSFATSWTSFATSSSSGSSVVGLSRTEVGLDRFLNMTMVKPTTKVTVRSKQFGQIGSCHPIFSAPIKLLLTRLLACNRSTAYPRYPRMGELSFTFDPSSSRPHLRNTSGLITPASRDMSSETPFPTDKGLGKPVCVLYVDCQLPS